MTFNAQFGETGRFWDNLGWSGSIVEPNCPDQFAKNDCFIDSLYQVEANVGINKVNPFIQRKIVDHIDLAKTEINHRRTVTYRNQAKIDSWPQGQYRAYVKFYLSKASLQPELFINGIKVSPDQVVNYIEQGRVVVGALILVPRNQTLTLELKYRQPIVTKLPFSYFFFNQKQSGTEETREVFLSYQPGLKVRQITPQAELSNQLLNFTLQVKPCLRWRYIRINL
jgi:hypothetical protein